jgi:Family of unknown function (DUF6067)
LHRPKDNAKQSRRDVLAFLGSAGALTMLPGSLVAERVQAEASEIDFPYTVPAIPWLRSLGNHRVRIYVDKPAEAVWAHIPWRRVDHKPEDKAVLVFSASGSEVANVTTLNINEEYGDILFEAKDPGEYFVYYLPQQDVPQHHSALGPKGRYRAPQTSSQSNWTDRFASQAFKASPFAWQQRLQARVVEFQARTELDSFQPMEVAATDREVRAMCARHVQPILLFPEDRAQAIQMYDKLPLRWIRNGPTSSFSGKALRGEFYVFQIGIYDNRAPSAGSTGISVEFHELAGPTGEGIPASAWMCLNTGGINQVGQFFQRDIQISPGAVAVLWCGVQIPIDAKQGKYSGNVNLSFTAEAGSVLHCDVEVMPDFIRDGGVDEPSRLARLKWLNSTVGSSGSVTSPYTPLRISERTVACLGREVQFGEDGFPTSIKVNANELLAAPVALKVYSGSTTVEWKSKSIIYSADADRVVFNARSERDGYVLQVKTTMEFDGGIGCEVELVSNRVRSVKDIALEIQYTADAVPYAIGMGVAGGKRPQAWHWKWSEQPPRWKEQGSNLEFFFWLGGAHSGLYCRLKSPLQDWQNNTIGGVDLTETGNRVLFRASGGPRTVLAGETMSFSFRLLPTPLKPMDPDHWKYRYVQAYEPPVELQKLGATVINLHQGTPPNLHINYPFLNMDLLVPYLSSAHALGMKVKLYYTMRELSTRLPELWAFRSLGNEIYRSGGTQGQGNPQLDFWLQEHLRDNYSPGWITLTREGQIDPSLRIYSDSRLVNFYLEGLKWLLLNAPIDGLYLDEIGYSRETMQRVRRVLEERPGAMIDMHGNREWWSCNCPIGYYMEHLPYIDRLWLGEAFDPDSSPEFWLIEMSGIPFGVSSDMLERPNPWRGMLFGMTARARWSGVDPGPLWELWDSFGIQDSTMVGWWENNCPVETGNSDVRATVYQKKGKALVAIASWAKAATSVRLALDWKELDMDKHKVSMEAPRIEGMQDARSFAPGQPIAIQPGKGCLILIAQA